MRLQITGMGVDTHHDPREVMDRPGGMPHFLLACFTTPFIGLDHGEKYVGKSGDCVLRTPNMPDYFASIPDATEGFRGDWLHIEGDLTWELIRKYGVPTDRYVPTGKPHLITELVSMAMAEEQRAAPFWREAIEQLVERMFMLFARCAYDQRSLTQLSPAERHHFARFEELRTRIRNEFSSSWSMASMARELGLSASRFGALYRKFFGTTATEDLLDARLAFARERLIAGRESVGMIAEASGFASIYHFSRMFKRRMGCSPSQYAKTNGF